ncbi:hypothetical protein HD597_000452 [Nonomuraea thailandensis]|uniref:Uncharacterized protein n=1 Tax=Nonomuraea thailandensis TaxID=1188745 RepID=A0A9X2G6I0_9ACTN|nr:hypothetical protein [Nonomuraea thailandensis]MCP2353432.1 hypothetical protein [Nonomuraea thailandensis]
MAGAQQGVVATAGRAVQRWLRGVPVGCRHGEQVAAMTPPRFGPRAEEALRRTLRDIDEGHLTLWVRGRFFDEHTGARLDPPEIEVLPDRQPQPGVPDPRGDWWMPMLERGWLELPAPGPSMRYLVTDAGNAVLSSAAKPSGSVIAPPSPRAGSRPAADGAP